MEVMPSIYLSAATSPGAGSLDGMKFYSAPTSPAKEGADAINDWNSDFDNFEFETSNKVGEFVEFAISDNFECLLEEQQKQEKLKRMRGGSLPTMAFADELFFNGQVMPLKPPPRLQSGNDRSIPSSPKSPRSPSSVLKVPFVHRAAWNDDFDPFKVALEMVSDENRGRSSSAGSDRRRTRSHSPFRTTTSQWCNDSGRSWNLNQSKETGHLDSVQNLGPHSVMHKQRSKGSHYARWVLDQTKQVEQSSKWKTMFKAFSFRGRVRPWKIDHEGSNKSISSEIVEEDEKNDVRETKTKGIKGILLRYASFRRENSEAKSTDQVSTARKSSYFKKLSFRIKRKSSFNGKIRVNKQPKMAVVEYKLNKPTLALCVYGVESPRNIKRIY